MSEANWLDTGSRFAGFVSDWVVQQLPNTREDHNRDGGGATIFSDAQINCLKKAFEQAFRSFAEKVDERFSNIEGLIQRDQISWREFDDRLGAIDSKIIEVTTRALCLGEDVTSQEAFNQVTISRARNSRRNFRRKRTKEKYKYQRDVLLQMRPRMTDHATVEMCGHTASTRDRQLTQRVTNLEALVNPLVEHASWFSTTWQPLPSGIPATTLQWQCSAVISIQRTRRRFARLKATQQCMAYVTPDYLDMLLDEMALHSAIEAPLHTFETTLPAANQSEQLGTSAFDTSNIAIAVNGATRSVCYPAHDAICVSEEDMTVPLGISSKISYLLQSCNR